MPVIFTLAELQRLQQEQERVELSLIPERPLTPANFTASGRKFGFICQWAKADGVDGYQLAVMTVQNLAAPQLLVDCPGKDTMNWEYFVGDVALTRYFSVQSYKNSVTGERLYSEWFYPIRSAVSKVDGGVADAAPTAPPAPAPSPDTTESQGDPAGIRTEFLP